MILWDTLGPLPVSSVRLPWEADNILASLQGLLREASLTDASGNTTLLYQNKVAFGQCLLSAMGWHGL